MFFLMSLLSSCAFLDAQRQRWLVYHILIMVFKAFTIEMCMCLSCVSIFMYMCLDIKSFKVYVLYIEL